MSQKRPINTILTIVFISLIIVGGYFIFTKLSYTNKANPPNSLIGKWNVVSVQEGDIQIVSEINGASIEFFKDGTLKAYGGCNEMTQESYEVKSGSELSISIGGTKRGCERDVVEFWNLNKVTKYKFTDNMLFLYYKTDSEVESTFKLLLQTDFNYNSDCTKFGGEWIEEYNECSEGFGTVNDVEGFCTKYNGKYNECDSECRHNSDPEIYCPGVCVQVCSI